MVEHSYLKDFQYSTNNPYSDRLKAFDEFVFQDNEAESFRGNWNQEIFKRDAPLILEIGSGFGEFMMSYCEQNPHVNYVGMDYRFKRSFSLAKKLDKKVVKNFRYLRAKGERIEFLFDTDELSAIFYFFPDPWPKTRHHKKRLFQKHFLERAWKVLKPEGKFYIKTDHDGYADWMLEVVNDTKFFTCNYTTKNLWQELDQQNHFLCQGKTKFEEIFIAKNINIKALELTSTKRTHGT